MSEENKNLQNEESEASPEIQSKEEAIENNEIPENNETAESEEAVEGFEVAEGSDSLEACEEQPSDELFAEEEVKAEKKNKKLFRCKVPVGAYLLSTVAVILATVLLTYSLCAEFFRAKYADNIVVQEETAETPKTGVDLLDQYIDAYYYGECDKDEMLAAALKAYVAATGDPYAYYYTLEELIQNQQESASKMCGIGVNVAYEVIEIEGESVSTIHIFNVMSSSPAKEAGLMAGDLIVNVKTADGVKSVTELGYAGTLDEFLGEEGSFVEFGVLRKNAEGGYEEKQFNIERKQIESETVYIEPLEADSSIGLIKLLEFNYKTPVQFEKRMDELINSGCEKFIIDLRGNPGGYEISIAAVLSFFLNEGDLYIQTKNAEGVVKKSAITPVNYTDNNLQGCSISKEKIGKYRDIDIAVLCDKNTASASELFVANFKDYGLGTIVGVGTHGKGSMQTTYMLNGGFSGAIKITTHKYYSGGDTELVGYDQVGIEPDIVATLDEKFSEINVHIVPQSEDAQLQAAIDALNS